MFSLFLHIHWQTFLYHLSKLVKQRTLHHCEDSLQLVFVHHQLRHLPWQLLEWICLCRVYMTVYTFTDRIAENYWGGCAWAVLSLVELLQVVLGVNLGGVGELVLLVAGIGCSGLWGGCLSGVSNDKLGAEGAVLGSTFSCTSSLGMLNGLDLMIGAVVGKYRIMHAWSAFTVTPAYPYYFIHQCIISANARHIVHYLS